MAVQWAYLENGFERPPVDSARLRELAASGAVTPATPVRRLSAEGASPWKRAGEVSGLFSGDVSGRLGGEICGACGTLLKNGQCPTCSLAVAKPVAEPAFDVESMVREAKEVTPPPRQVVYAPSPGGQQHVVIVGVRLPIMDAVNLIVTFYVASLIIGAILGAILAAIYLVLRAAN